MHYRASQELFKYVWRGRGATYVINRRNYLRSWVVANDPSRCPLLKLTIN